MKTVTTSVGFQDPLGNLVLSGNLVLTLSQAAEVTSGGGLIAPKVVVLALSATTAKIASTQIWFNDELTPTGTTYHSELLDSGGNIIADFGQWSITGASADLSTMVPVTSATVSLPGVVLTAPALTQAVVQPTGTSLNVNRLENIRFADQFAGADLGAKINAAAADAASNGIIVIPPGISTTSITTALSLPTGTTVIFPPGTFSISSGHTISNVHVRIIGSGIGTILAPTSATGTIFTITGAACEVGSMSVAPSVTRTAGAFLEGQTNSGYVHDLVITDMYDGLVLQTSGASGWTFSNIDIETVGGNWHNAFRSGPIASGTLTSNVITGFKVNVHSGTISGPFINIDSGTDGLKMVHLEVSKTSTADSNPAILVQNTSTAQNPSFVRFVNCFVESNTTSIGLRITNATDLGVDNCFFGPSLQNIKIESGKGIKIANSSMLLAQQGAILITGGSDLDIAGNDISDDAAAAANTYDAISIAAGISGFRIIGNRIGTWAYSGNSFRDGINIAAGASDNYTVVGNVITNSGTTNIVDGGTGVNKTVLDPSGSALSFINGGIQFNSTGASAATSFGLHDAALGATPNKYLRVSLGSFQIVDSGFTTALFGITDIGNQTLAGKISNYNNIATAGNGIPSVYASTSQKTESAADTNVLTYTPPAAVGSYRVRFTMAVSAQNTATLGWTATWKDANGSAQAPTNLALFTTGVAAPALTVTAATNGNYHGQLDIDTDNSATAIVVKLTFTGTSFTAKVSATVERLI